MLERYWRWLIIEALATMGAKAKGDALVREFESETCVHAKRLREWERERSVGVGKGFQYKYRAASSSPIH